jgi:hypothetical protein
MYELRTDSKLTSAFDLFIFHRALIRGWPEHGIESDFGAGQGTGKKYRRLRILSVGSIRIGGLPNGPLSLSPREQVAVPIGRNRRHGRNGQICRRWQDVREEDPDTMRSWRAGLRAVECFCVGGTGHFSKPTVAQRGFVTQVK